MSERAGLNTERYFNLDPEAEANRISACLVHLLRSELKRRGLVVALSGGVDSSVACALAVRAVGPERVFGLLMPEADSSPESVERATDLCQRLSIHFRVDDITHILEAIGCYRWRDEAIQRVFPEYKKGWRHKIAIGRASEGPINYFRLIVELPGGDRKEARLGSREYLQIVAATNFKQRIRKTLEYFHADRLHYAVVGTPNRVEHDQGFFVKNGDGAADLKPIAHLYKTQVYMLAKYLGLPESIAGSTPTTDTYSLPQGQEEFYFGLPYHEMDVALWHVNQGRSAAALAEALGLAPEEAALIVGDIQRKRMTTGPLHWPAIPVEPVPGPRSQPPLPPDSPCAGEEWPRG